MQHEFKDAKVEFLNYLQGYDYTEVKSAIVFLLKSLNLQTVQIPDVDPWVADPTHDTWFYNDDALRIPLKRFGQYEGALTNFNHCFDVRTTFMFSTVILEGLDKLIPEVEVTPRHLIALIGLEKISALEEKRFEWVHDIRDAVYLAIELFHELQVMDAIDYKKVKEAFFEGLRNKIIDKGREPQKYGGRRKNLKYRQIEEALKGHYRPRVVALLTSKVESREKRTLPWLAKKAFQEVLNERERLVFDKYARFKSQRPLGETNQQFWRALWKQNPGFIKTLKLYVRDVFDEHRTQR